MFRAAIAVVVGGYAFGGIGSSQPTGMGDGVVSHVAAGVTPAMRTVEYRGYELDVPAGWPVYRLDRHPDQCVRYDMHAVYLGKPGGDQHCPPGLVGRTETVSVGASSLSSASLSPAGARPSAPSAIGQRADVNDLRAGRAGIVLQDASLQEFGVALPSSAPAVTATYGSDPGLIEQVLASVHRVVPQSAPLGDTQGRAVPRPHRRQARHSRTMSARAKPNPVASPDPDDTPPFGMPPDTSPYTGFPTDSGMPADSGMPGDTGIPADTGMPTAEPTDLPGSLPTAPPTPPVPTPPAGTVGKGPQSGFDTCTAPSLKAMSAWRTKFSATAIYIGGAEMACDYGNLSAAWVHATEAMGWSLLPTYVGPQAPCNNFSASVDEKHAADQGRQNAQWAVQNAQQFGLAKGSPIYYDMEAYNNKKARCVTAVMTFLDAWTRQLNAEGYVSGVYSSAGSAVIDLAKTTDVAGHKLAEPQAIWFALWDHSSDLNGAPYLPQGMWPAVHRSKQYAGGHWLKVGKIGMNVDSDLVNSAAVS